MPSLKDIRGRIGSVRNIAQITRAMEMVAASRMKRAQDAILAARPYAEELDGGAAPRRGRRPPRRSTRSSHGAPCIGRRSSSSPPTAASPARSTPTPRAPSCAGWRSGRRSAAGDRPVEIEAITVGRKGRDAIRRAGVPIAAHFAQLGERPSFADVTPIARLVTEDFLAEKYDEIDIAYSGFVSTLSQKPQISTILPIAAAGDGGRGRAHQRRVPLRAVARGGAEPPAAALRGDRHLSGRAREQRVGAVVADDRDAQLPPTTPTSSSTT